MDPILVGRVKNETMTEENALACLATYLGQIEIMDGQIGEVRKAVFACAARDGRPAVFGYTSDHGDACGEIVCMENEPILIPLLRFRFYWRGTRLPQGV